jgi:RNA 3'-terminal phosphate cyclase
MCGVAVLDGPQGGGEIDSARQPVELLTYSYPVEEGEVNVVSALVHAARHPREVIEHTLNWYVAVRLLQ